MTRDRSLWTAAVALWVVGDLATTWLGLRLGAVERHPAAAQAIEAGGPAVLLPMQLAALALFVAAYVSLGSVGVRERVGIPIGLALLGAAIVANNAAVIAVGWSA